MSNCSSKIVMSIGTPTTNDYNYCKSNSTAKNTSNYQIGDGSCNNNRPLECCNKQLLGPRNKRENVRDKLKDYVLLKLGAPQIEVELDEQQIDLIIDEVLDIYESYVSIDFYDFYTFTTTPGKSVYTLPPDVGLIRAVHYNSLPNFVMTSRELGGSVPLEYLYPGGSQSTTGNAVIDPNFPMWGRTGEWALYKSYEKLYADMSSHIGGWQYVGGRNTIKLYPMPCCATQVIVHHIQKCKDWDCVDQAMRDGVLCHAQILLGEIRSKYQNIPGPQGGVVLNGQDILQRGLAAKEQWEQRLLDRYGDILGPRMG